MMPGTARSSQQRRPWLRHGVGWLALLALVLLFILQVGFSPWVLHIGGTFTPTMSWSGYGIVTGSNGGRYVLYADFRAGFLAARNLHGMVCSGRGCDNLRGTAKLCSLSGTETFALTGDVHSWLRTEGARTDLGMTGGTPKPLPDGWRVALRGTWHGSALTVASPDNSFTEVFTPRGAIRSVTSTANAGTAKVTLRPGSAEEFNRACRRLASG